MDPLPPRVDCEQPKADSPGLVPRTADQVQWTAWARAVLGLIKQDRTYRDNEHACIADLKRKGVIR